jgi:Tfp pilus assembly protein PilX
MHAAAQPHVTKELLIKLLELGANSRLLDNKRRSALTHAMIAQQLRLMPALGAAGEKYRQQQQQQQRRSSCSCSHSNASAAGCTPVPGYYYAAVGSKCGSPPSASSSAALECAVCADRIAGDAVANNNTSSPSQQQQQADGNGESSSMPAVVGQGEADAHNNSSAASSSTQDGGSKPALLSSFSSNPLPLPNHSRCVIYASIAMHLPVFIMHVYQCTQRCCATAQCTYLSAPSSNVFVCSRLQYHALNATQLTPITATCVCSHHAVLLRNSVMCTLCGYGSLDLFPGSISLAMHPQVSQCMYVGVCNRIVPLHSASASVHL